MPERRDPVAGGLSRFDAADYIDDAEDAALYLQIVAAESADDPAEMARAREVITRAGHGDVSSSAEGAGG